MFCLVQSGFSQTKKKRIEEDDNDDNIIYYWNRANTRPAPPPVNHYEHLETKSAFVGFNEKEIWYPINNKPQVKIRVDSFEFFSTI